MPPEVSPKEEEDFAQATIDAGVEEISSDLFPKDKDPSVGDDEGEPGEASDPASVVEAPPVHKDEPKAELENSEEVQAVGAPKTWSKEEIATWATIPKEMQEKLSPILARREEDYLKGITMYKSAAELGARYDEVVEPFRAVLAAENVNPVDLFKAFASNHYILSRGTPEQKLSLTANLIQGYDIDLEQLLTYMGEQNVVPVDPEIATLKQKIAELENGFNSRTQVETERTVAIYRAEVDKFADDGQHPYFNEVADNIARFIESGSAGSLQEAYEQAVWANPLTRQKELDRLAAEKEAAAKQEEAERANKRRKAQGDHVSLDQRSKNGTVPVGSMDDTLNETWQNIQSRG